MFLEVSADVDRTDEPVVQGGLTDAEKRDNVIRLAFGGKPELLEEFCRAVRDVVPPGTTVVLRGSSVTGMRWDGKVAFDGAGPGTSDLDLTLVGADVLRYYSAFWIPGMHSKPLSDEDPDIAPALKPLREELVSMVNRPVNIQGTRDWVQYFRGDIMNQPYLTLFGTIEEP